MDRLPTIRDDPKLLSLMMEDAKHAPSHYQTTNYWLYYEKEILERLRGEGLEGYRGKRNRALAHFGGSDSPPARQVNLSLSRVMNNRFTRKLPGWQVLLNVASAGLDRVIPIRGPFGADREALWRLVAQYTRALGELRGARPLGALEPSLVGSPRDTVVLDGVTYPLSVLTYYLRYAYCCQYLDFDSVRVVVELGSGAGQQVEVIRKLHPEICFLVFDIPPALYVCGQYLQAVFPDAVVPYRETRQLAWPPSFDTSGKIFILGNWRFGLLDSVRTDLFWNAASFQEMEPSVVAHYLMKVNASAGNVYLLEKMEGNRPAGRKGKGGVLEPTKWADYERGLADFDLVNTSPSLGWLPDDPTSPYSHTFWRHRGRV